MNSIKILEQLGQNSSINQFDTLQEMLFNLNLSEVEIGKLIDSNIPLICAWVPDDDNDKDDNDKEDDKEDEQKESLKLH